MKRLKSLKYLIQIMQFVESADATRIAYTSFGAGKELIIVAGALADQQNYVPLATELSTKLLVFNYDRRNRGNNDITHHHNVASELDDLHAIVSLCSEAPVIYGHSSGAALAIRAVASGIKANKLILSDLPFSPMNSYSRSQEQLFVEERKTIRALLELGDKEAAVKHFLKDFGMNDQELDSFVKSDHGHKAVQNGPTLLIDYDLLGNGFLPGSLLTRITVSTLVLTSEEGIAVAEEAAGYLARGRIMKLSGPTYSLSPEAVAKPIFDFLDGIE